MEMDYKALVTMQLQAAGITASEAEIEAFAAQTPARLRAVAALYAVPEARYEEMELLPARDLDVLAQP